MFFQNYTRNHTITHKNTKFMWTLFPSCLINHSQIEFVAFSCWPRMNKWQYTKVATCSLYIRTLFTFMFFSISSQKFCEVSIVCLQLRIGTDLQWGYFKNCPIRSLLCTTKQFEGKTSLTCWRQALTASPHKHIHFFFIRMKKKPKWKTKLYRGETSGVFWDTLIFIQLSISEKFWVKKLCVLYIQPRSAANVWLSPICLCSYLFCSAWATVYA
jgi:hypothetical protein